MSFMHNFMCHGCACSGCSYDKQEVEEDVRKISAPTLSVVGVHAVAMVTTYTQLAQVAVGVMKRKLRRM